MRIGLTLGLLSVFLLPSPASPAGQGETSLSGGLGMASLFQDRASIGAQAEFRLVRGLSDCWAARLGLAVGWLAATGNVPTTHVATQIMGVTWSADIANLVPFADFGVTVSDIRGGGRGPSQRLGPQVGLGADYLLSRHYVLSAVARLDYFGLRLAGSHRPNPTQLTLGILAGRAF
jgi:hypothetical protein